MANRGRPSRYAARTAEGVRQIWRYPNRRLYDPVRSRYARADEITATAEPFIVIDTRNGEDITASIIASARAHTLRTEQNRGDSVVYFIRSGESGPIKIGLSSTSKVEQRVSELQTGSPERLRLLGFVNGDRDAEQFLHRCFASLGIGGEWFKPDPSLVSFIATTLASGALEYTPEEEPEQLDLLAHKNSRPLGG
jgi:hypothetical protein